MERISNAAFVKAVAKKTGYATQDIREVLVAVESVMTELLSKGEEVKALPSVTFKVTERSARVGRNPKTGESVNVPAMKTIKAKFTASFKDAIQ